MFKNPFSFNGRIRRLEYGLSTLIYLAVYMPLALMAESDPEGSSGMILLIVIIPLLWFYFAQGAKRCHDLGNSGWYQLIPFYGLWLLFAKGQEMSNEYGPNPKNPESSEMPLDSHIVEDKN